MGVPIFYKGDSTFIDSVPIVDGQILFDEDNQVIYMDDGNTRKAYGSSGFTMITYTNFMNLTPYEREHGKYLITNVGSFINAYGIPYKNGQNVGQALDIIEAS